MSVAIENPTEFERVVVARGARSGCQMAVAVHSTRLGPALGGARMWRYPEDERATDDARRLAAAMTLKAAAAGLDLGGGKGVITATAGIPPIGEERRAILLDFGDLVESFGGSYITAEDVGTGAEDMAVIAERTTHVVGLGADRGGSGDPSPITALGVRAAMRACVGRRFGTPSLAGHTICVIGLGHVGEALARLLAADGAELIASDIEPGRKPHAERLGARWVDPAEAMQTRCDVLAPCALGGVIGRGNVDSLRTQIVCGAANNVLAGADAAELLAEQGVLYAPDFIANAGGLISVYGELKRLPAERAFGLAEGIETTMGSVLETAASHDTTPLAAARELAERRLSAAA